LYHGLWTLMGLPMFLLFVGPLFAVLVVAVKANRTDEVATLGGCLIIVTVAAQAFCYFFANNNETPRLWIPFLVVLTVALAMRRDLFRRDTLPHRRLCLLLIALQISLTALHWSMMDVRETEYRLTTGRYWN